MLRILGRLNRIIKCQQWQTRPPPHYAGRGCRWGPPCPPWTTWPGSPSWWGWRSCYTAGRRCDPCCQAPRRHLKRWKHLFIVNAKPWKRESCRSTNFRSSWCRPLKVEVVTELHLLSSDDSDQHLMYWLHFSIAALWNKRVHPGTHDFDDNFTINERVY